MSEPAVFLAPRSAAATADLELLHAARLDLADAARAAHPDAPPARRRRLGRPAVPSLRPGLRDGTKVVFLEHRAGL